jgi:acetyl-CoA carboxylase biotin carboxyl carrier protein
MDMDLQYLRRLLKIFDESTAVELEIEEQGVKIRLSRAAAPVSIPALPALGSVPQPSSFNPSSPPYSAESIQQQPSSVQQSNQTDSAKKTHHIVSPIVGTFYRAPAPDADSFVQIGTRIAPGQTLCIIEAMKLMNEIEGEVAGTVVKILVENGQPVEYNQPLILVELD